MTTEAMIDEDAIQQEIREKVQEGLNCLTPPASVIGYDALINDGKNILCKRLATSNGQSVSYWLMADVKSMLDHVRGPKRVTSDIQLCRLLGYLEAMTNLLGGLPTIQGVKFVLNDTGAFSMTIDQTDSEGKADVLHHEIRDIDKLEGPAYEAALEAMTPEERAKHLKSN